MYGVLGKFAPGTGEWHHVVEIDVKQERLLDLHLGGYITTEQFRAKSAELEEARAAAEGQLEAARSRLVRLKDIEQSKEALVSHYASLVPQALSELSSEEKNRIYKMMHLQVLAQRDGTLIADWGCNVLPQPRWSSTFTINPFRFRAVLTDDGSEEVVLVRA